MKLLHGDCLDLFSTIEAGSVDLILCDLPYGITGCPWDSVIPLDQLWVQYERVLVQSGAVVLTASQPFSARLVMSKLDWFRYQWVWRKERPSNPQLAKKQPLKIHEDVLVFGPKPVRYYPQGLVEIPEDQRRIHNPETNALGHCKRKPYIQTHTNYPRSIIEFGSERGLHPTQKPVQLMEYLVRTYSAEGAVVLDNCMGSGSTGIAAIKAGRRFIGMERDPVYFQLACDRLKDTK